MEQNFKLQNIQNSLLCRVIAKKIGTQKLYIEKDEKKKKKRNVENFCFHRFKKIFRRRTKNFPSN